MYLNDYQKRANSFALYPNAGDNFVYPALGLCGESGEVAEKFKKIIRDKGGKISVEDRAEIIKELGDVMWYVAALCMELKVDMYDVAFLNISKLESRKQRSVLQGSGDNR